MTTYKLYKEQYLPINIEHAWEFFSAAGNLEKITPPDMSFKILTKMDGQPVHSGQKIDYIVKPLLGIPVRWTTEITGVNAPFAFMDRQLKGPYKLWEHTHTFETVPGGVRMTDTVKYALPFGILGTLMHKLVVKNKLDSIFTFREKTLNDLFGTYKKR